jgi:hypothetical protein
MTQHEVTVLVPDSTEQKRPRDTDNPDSTTSFWHRFPSLTETEVLDWQHHVFPRFHPTPSSPSYTTTSTSYPPTGSSIDREYLIKHTDEQIKEDTDEQLGRVEKVLGVTSPIHTFRRYLNLGIPGTSIQLLGP